MLTPILLVLGLMGCRATTDDTAGEVPIDETGVEEVIEDADGDGFSTDDCDDADAAINPGADELCDGIDNNCDGAVDELSDANDTLWYADADGDGFGDSDTVVAACEQPANAAASDTDCDDTNAAINPDATEDDCTDPVDYNCDGNVGFADGDADGFAACEECDDTNADVNPGATEVTYDGLDNDCDETTLDDDLDGDGAVGADDCDDTNPAINPSATEVAYDGVDNDCDETTLDDDLDGDGAVNADDCNDNDAAINPAATETPYDGVDNDCDETTLDDDLDGDGAVNADDCNDNDAAINPAATETPYDGVDNDCDETTLDDDLDGDGAVNADDCNDNDAAINPAATETPYDGVDNDCDVSTLDDDLDEDGVNGADDCNDDDASIFPGATDEWYDGVDSNCDSANDFDQDGDGEESASMGNGVDCDDNDDAVTSCGDSPGSAGETCSDLISIDDSLVSGVYWIDPTGDAPFKAYCDMAIDGGGWTLISNRREGSVNVETCGSILNEFFVDGCGDAENIAKDQSFALSGTVRSSLPRTHFMVLQYLNDVLDEDDAYIVEFDGEMFPNTTELEKLPVTGACSLDGATCDTDDVFWLYTGDSWYHSSLCGQTYAGSKAYRGNYGLCHEGITTNYNSSGFVGDRSGYQETKLWAHPAGSNAYQERVFVR